MGRELQYAVDSSRKETASCPYCRSPRVAAAVGKQVASAYRRCEICGQIWHPDRLPTPQVRRFDR